MAKTPKPDDAPEASPLPSEGGAWIRQKDGSLIRDPAEHPPEPDAAESAVELPLKEA